MPQYRSRRVRVLDQEEKRIVHRIAFAVVGLIILGAAVIFGGIPVLVSLGALISGTKTQAPIADSNNPLLSPDLDPVDTATNSSTIDITGSGQEGTTVILFVNNQQYSQKLVGKDGTFDFGSVPLTMGQNSFYAEAKSSDGKTTSPSSQTRQITFDNKPPQLTVDNPQDQQNFSNNTKDITVSGKTDPNTTVTVNDTIAIVNADGTFSVDLPVATGKIDVKIVATDVAGNQTTIDRTIYNNS